MIYFKKNKSEIPCFYPKPDTFHTSPQMRDNELMNHCGLISVE